jgi:glycosyltransferase involved in cell wall biosynthesis
MPTEAAGLRLLYVIDSLDQGGAEQSLVDLAPHLATEGVDLSIAVLRPGGMLEARARSAKANIIHVQPTERRSRRVERLQDVIEEHRPELVHTTLFEADVAGRIAASRRNVPVVSSVVNLAYSSDHRRAPGLRPHRVVLAQAADVATARLVRRFHTNAASLVAPMSKRLLVPRRRFDVIARGRDDELLGTRSAQRRADVRFAMELDEYAPVVLAAARHEHQKGLDVLLDAIATIRNTHPNVVLLLAGRDGNRTAALRYQATRLGLDANVRFLGARDDIPDLLVAADVFALPSRWEGLPGAVIEAMALETPLVATDLPGVREVLGPELLPGRIVAPEDAAALADRIVATIADPEGAQEWARAARRRFLRRFTTRQIAKEMVDFYARALDPSI